MTDYYVDGAVGNDGNAGTSEGSGNAWATIDHAMNTVAAGDRVFVKASANYNELVTIDTAGSATNGIAFIGYTTTTTDNGQVTIDAQATRTNCVINAAGTSDIRYLFANFIFDDATGDCFDTVGGDCFTFFNCDFTNGGDRGFQGDNKNIFIQCAFAGNTNSPLDADTETFLIASTMNANNADGPIINSGALILSVVHNVGASSQGLTVNGNVTSLVVNSTLDGENNAGNTAIDFSGTGLDLFTVVNAVLYDFANGTNVAATLNQNVAMVNNLVNSVTTEYVTNAARFESGKVTSAPSFTDEAGDDYSLGGSSPALDAGLDASDA